MENTKKIGEVYEFCATCSTCPVAVETEVNGKSGLEIQDDFGGSARLTDENLRDLRNFLDKRFGL